MARRKSHLTALLVPPKHLPLAVRPAGQAGKDRSRMTNATGPLSPSFEGRIGPPRMRCQGLHAHSLQLDQRWG